MSTGQFLVLVALLTAWQLGAMAHIWQLKNDLQKIKEKLGIKDDE